MTFIVFPLFVGHCLAPRQNDAPTGSKLLLTRSVLSGRLGAYPGHLRQEPFRVKQGNARPRVIAAERRRTAFSTGDRNESVADLLQQYVSLIACGVRYEL
jgi:hypothetical protein